MDPAPSTAPWLARPLVLWCSGALIDRTIGPPSQEGNQGADSREAKDRCLVQRWGELGAVLMSGPSPVSPWSCQLRRVRTASSLLYVARGTHAPQCDTKRCGPTTPTTRPRSRWRNPARLWRCSELISFPLSPVAVVLVGSTRSPGEITQLAKRMKGVKGGGRGVDTGTSRALRHHQWRNWGHVAALRGGLGHRRGRGDGPSLTRRQERRPHGPIASVGDHLPMSPHPRLPHLLADAVSRFDQARPRSRRVEEWVRRMFGGGTGRCHGRGRWIACACIALPCQSLSHLSAKGIWTQS